MRGNRPLFNTLVHLRLPFSFFLLPIFLFGIFVSRPHDALKAWAAFFVIHFLLYPASHAFNTWYDRDEGSIGGLKSPPPVEKSLFWAAWILDALALLGSFWIGWFFGVCMLLYTLGSKLYSWEVTRIKKRPFLGWLGVGIIQGSLTCLAVVQGLGTAKEWTDPNLWFAVVLSAIFLWGVYPLTQIYQHEEDARHGDMTISRYVGIRGTFVLSAVFLGAAVGAFLYLFVVLRGWNTAFLFAALQTPTLIFFLVWAVQGWIDEKKANFTRTMVMNLLASGSMNLFFLLEIWP